MKFSKPVSELTFYEREEEMYPFLGRVVANGVEVVIRAEKDGIGVCAYEPPYETPSQAIGIPLSNIIDGTRECRERLGG